MGRNVSLEGLRGVAVLMVLAFHLHLAICTGGFSWQPNGDGLASRLLGTGHHGVELFFMISGYLIVVSLVRCQSVGRFLFQRLVRIYPAFLVPHMLIFVIGPCIGYGWMSGLDPAEYTAHFLSNLLMLPGFFDLPIANIVAWTLSLEMVFYLLAASAFGLISTGKSAAVRGGYVRGRGVLLAVLAFAWLAVAAAALWRHPRGWFFLAGVAVYFAQASANIRWRPPVWTAAPALGLMVGLFQGHFALSVVSGLLGFWAVVNQRDLATRLLRHPLLCHFGRISYSLYLWHALVLFVLKRLFGGSQGLLAQPAVNVIVFLLTATALSWLSAWLSYEVVEDRLTKWFLGWGPVTRMPLFMASAKQAGLGISRAAEPSSVEPVAVRRAA